MNKSSDCFYRSARFPSDLSLFSQIDAAASTLAQKLDELDVHALPISDYNKRYFEGHAQKPNATLEHYTYLMLWALTLHKLALAEIVLVDHGGGSGFISILAKQLGVGTVIYNDIYDVSCRDAEEIGKRLGLAADYYVCGDTEDLFRGMRALGLQPNAIISFNVIEHIYDIDAFLDCICHITEGPMSLAFASSANTLNPRTRWLTMAHHRRKERQDAEVVWGNKERDTLQSYLGARREIIQGQFPQLTESEVENLAERTRGLMKRDIVQRVGNYIRSGVLPAALKHPTNTCDPFTGNWAEHLMNPAKLLERIESHGFKGQVLAGYYNRYEQWWKHGLTRALNLAIETSGRPGLRLAPHYIVYGRNF